MLVVQLWFTLLYNLKLEASSALCGLLPEVCVALLLVYILSSKRLLILGTSTSQAQRRFVPLSSAVLLKESQASPYPGRQIHGALGPWRPSSAGPQCIILFHNCHQCEKGRASSHKIAPVLVNGDCGGRDAMGTHTGHWVCHAPVPLEL